MNEPVYVLSRLLGWLGWVAVLAGFFGQGVPGFIVLPGLVLMLLGRVLRLRARTEPGELEDLSMQQPSDRPLNTDRRPTPPVIPGRSPEYEKLAPRGLPSREQRADPVRGSLSERNVLLEQVLAPATEAAPESDETDQIPDPASIPDLDHTPMTSEEMIARARERFYRKD